MADTEVADAVDEPAPMAATRRRPRRLIALVVAAVVVLAVGISTATVWVRHYSAAPALEWAGGAYGWIGAGDRPTDSDVSLGPYSVLQTRVRPGDTRTFLFWVHNPASVTQTITGPLHPGLDTAQPTRVTVSDLEPGRGNRRLTFHATPVAVPPHEDREVHVTVTNKQCLGTLRLSYRQFDLAVHVGGFERAETIDFDTTAFTMTGVKGAC